LLIDPFGLEAKSQNKKAGPDCEPLRKERQKLIKSLTTGGAGVGMCESPCAKITIIVELEDSCVTGLMGKIGHVGIGIGAEYFDWGPVPNITGVFGAIIPVEGSQWWDGGRGVPDSLQGKTPAQINLVNIVDAIRAGEMGIHDIFTVEVCVCKADADRAKRWWLNRYEKGGTFALIGDTCGSTVADSLAGAKCGRFPKATFAMSPQDYLVSLSWNATHGCGSNKGRTAKVEQILEEPEHQSPPAK
jgi:hypothetical protein